ncbi:hypothetical protein JCM10295v2_007043 [Rhodotorula toruloides]
MAAVAGGVLAAEVHQAGGVGFIGGGHTPLENLKLEVQKARETLSLAPDADLPVGIGLILWRLEQPHLPPTLAQSEPDRWLRYVIYEARASAVWLSFTTGSLGEWVKRVRRVEQEGGGERKERVRVVAMVQTEQAARELLEGGGVDAIVAQGTGVGDVERIAAADEIVRDLVSSVV